VLGRGVRTKWILRICHHPKPKTMDKGIKERGHELQLEIPKSMSKSKSKSIFKTVKKTIDKIVNSLCAGHLLGEKPG